MGTNVTGNDGMVERDNQPTVIRLLIPETYKKCISLMVYNGSGVCLIKRSALLPHVHIDYNNVSSLSGITEDLVQTYGTTLITIANKPELFHVVSDDFPISQDALLGRPFFKKNKAIINYYYETLILDGDPMNPIAFHRMEPLKTGKDRIKVNIINKKKQKGERKNQRFQKLP